ncbi:PQQ-binding-like beta-propeller repeat protein [Kitasatospora sp. NE20-6]|uniref:outer membrane protein assembly factor BamB family protein n=1 Tax=Kitasatospora sp. NE20-6 TaxID=2859066 RepID=UPI0038B27725
MAASTTGGAPSGAWRRVPAVLVLIGVPLALVGGLASCVASETGHLPGDSMERVWDTPYDRTAAGYGNAAWALGDTVVRSRFDAVTAFDAGTGERRWEYAVPGRAEICATGNAADSVVLVGLTEGKGCATVAAIDLEDGRELWRTGRRPGSAAPKDGSGSDTVAAGAGLAVVLDEDERRDEEPAEGARPVIPGDQALRAFDLRTGAPRWKAAVPEGCLPRRVAVAPQQVLAVLGCGTEAKLAAFDPADGRERWTVPLDARRPVAADSFTSFLSAEPTVLKVQEPVGHGVHAYFAFGQDGRRQGKIDVTGDEAAVADGKLFAAGHGVVAYDLVSGDEVWSSDSLGTWRGVTGMHAGGGRVTVFTRSRKGLDELYVYDSATGGTVDERTFSRDTDDGNAELAGLFRHDDLLIAVRWGDGSRRPFSAYRTW